MTCQIGAADANDRPVWTVTLRYPKSLPPAYLIRPIWAAVLSLARFIRAAPERSL